MLWHRLLWVMALSLVLVCGLTAACDDDDDDDDDNDDDQGDDDDFASGPGDDLQSFCVSYGLACFGVDEATAGELCQEYVELEQECAPGATQRLFECTGNDCELWDECAEAWEDEINC